MLTLYGSAISNYYQKIKIALLERGLDFTEVLTPPSQEAEFLQKSPMGKIPFLAHDNFYLAESQAMIEYLEEVFTEVPSLYPDDPKERARCREILNITDLYLDLPLRPFFDTVLYKKEKPSGVFFDKALSTVQRGANALKQLVHFSPFIMGEQLTYADCSAAATWDIVEKMLSHCEIKNPLKQIKGFDDYYEMLMNRPHVKKAMRKRDVLRRAQRIARANPPRID